MNELALFAGAGGSILAGKLLGWRTVCAVEYDVYCRRVLLQRQRDGILPLFPIWDDIRTFDAREWHGRVDVVTAGFPCQPFSLAGKRLGAEDKRNLWPETMRVLDEVRPRFALLENVPNLLTSGYFGRVLGDLAEGGFDARWCVLSAAGCGAPHIRKRLWIVAYADGCIERRREQQERQSDWGDSHVARNGTQGIVADSDSSVFNGRISIMQMGRFGGTQETQKTCIKTGTQWSIEPDVGRVAHGVANRVDRLKALGNGWVPIVAAKAWEMMAAESLDGRPETGLS